MKPAFAICGRRQTVAFIYFIVVRKINKLRMTKKNPEDLKNLKTI